MKNLSNITGEQAAALAQIYKTGTAKQLWEAWTPENRIYFLLDHSTESFELMGEDFYKSSQDFANLTYDALPSPIQKSVIIHHAQGMYNEGGSMPEGGRVKTIKESDIQVGEKFTLINGEVVEIKRLFKENIDEDWVEFTRSSVGKPEESSVKQLKNFINNWRAEKKVSGVLMAGGGAAPDKSLQKLRDVLDGIAIDLEGEDEEMLARLRYDLMDDVESPEVANRMVTNFENNELNKISDKKAVAEIKKAISTYRGTSMAGSGGIGGGRFVVESGGRQNMKSVWNVRDTETKSLKTSFRDKVGAKLYAEELNKNPNLSDREVMDIILKMNHGGLMAGGGGADEGVDLFEDYDNIPAKVQKILDKYSKGFEDGDYEVLKKALEEVEKQGYTFEYYLDGQAYDLRKIGQKGKSEDSGLNKFEPIDAEIEIPGEWEGGFSNGHIKLEIYSKDGQFSVYDALNKNKLSPDFSDKQQAKSFIQGAEKGIGSDKTPNYVKGKFHLIKINDTILLRSDRKEVADAFILGFQVGKSGKVSEKDKMDDGGEVLKEKRRVIKKLLSDEKFLSNLSVSQSVSFMDRIDAAKSKKEINELIGKAAKLKRMATGGEITSSRDIPYNEVLDYADEKGLNTETEGNFKEVAMLLFKEKYEKGSSKLSPAKQKLQSRINTLKATKANAGAAAQKAIQKKIDVLQAQLDYNPSAKERAQANKGKFALDVPAGYSKAIYKKLWSMKILPRIHKLNGTHSIIVNSKTNLDKAYMVYSDMAKEKGEKVVSITKISRKL